MKPKKVKPIPIPDQIKRLHFLIVEKAYLKTDKHDKEIAQLELKIDAFFYGRKV